MHAIEDQPLPADMDAPINLLAQSLDAADVLPAEAVADAADVFPAEVDEDHADVPTTEAVEDAADEPPTKRRKVGAD